MRWVATIYVKHLTPMATFDGTCFGLAVVDPEGNVDQLREASAAGL